ncbi:MAG: hypothetical protein KDE31_36280, partial [Caldilineaceae bacterium]|nr:hypothetical protein [Caldilineaceae bacterium]
MSFSCYLFKRFPVCRFVIILSFVLISSTAIIISFSSAGATESTPINRVDDYLDAPNVGDALAGGAFSVSAWIKPTLLPDDINVPLSLRTSAGEHRQQIGYTPAGNFTYYDATIGWRFTGDTYPPNAWYFVTLVLDGAGNGILDVDGMPHTTFATPV